ncbi:choline O-acetyltransferase-like isoform X2 [Zootermopsis nevadensis]|nr:choline O-acetyltransferase-like isoform X2 [Zootermopsis nevadensis]
MVKAFGSSTGQGQRLQEKLLQLREEQDNWAYTWWLNDMYLNNPIPLPINSNPGMVFPPRSFRSAYDMARFAARIMTGILSHKDIMDRHAIPVERATSREKGQPLCMSQYYRLFTSYRQPGKTRDFIYTKIKHGEGDTNQGTENIIVACRNHLYVMALKPSEKNRLTEDEMTFQFLHILQDASCQPLSPPVGILTSERRDTWAVAREKLRQDKKNKQNLEVIENALLLVCLDEPLPASFNCRTLRSDVPETVRGHIVDSRDETNMSHQMIHGGGSAANSANRWFDTTVQIIISSDGVWGLCYEHSPSEGVAIVQLMDDVLKKCESMPTAPDNIPSNIQCQAPQRLEWVINQDSHQYIQDAIQNLDLMVEDLDFYVYRFPGYGKEYIKSVKCSPDAYIQLSLQLAYFRLYHKLVATYESASTRRFLLGRVDCIRSAHNETLQWVMAMCHDESGTEDIQSGKRVTFSLYDAQQKLQLFDEAMKKQTEIMVENILGQGIDVHLLGLRELAKDLGEPIPDIFQDDVYRTANHFSLSTSQVPTSSDSFMGYGPVVPDGYGASYNPRSNTIVFCLSAFHSCQNTSTWKLAHSLEESLNAMKDMLSSRHTKK